MAGRSASGMKMHLDKVPAREENMTPYDFMLSESQERMLICAKKGCEDKVVELFEKWDLDVAVIGEVSDTGNMELFWHGDRVADIPIDPITEEAPILDRPIKKPAYLDEIKDTTIDSFDKVSNSDAFDRLFSSVEVVNKAWVYEQYDSMVQTNTIKSPGSLDASVVRVKENNKAIAMSSDCNPRYCFIDPEGGAAAAVMESGRNVAMSGATPLAITDCLNYGNPEKPEIMWQFAKGCEGIKNACRELNTPVVSGNVSLYNETNGVGVFPTPSIAMVGVLDNQEKTLSSIFQKSGNSLYIVGETGHDFGGSLYMKELFNKVEGTLASVDFEKELKLWNFIIEANNKNLLKAAKDINVGGVAIALAKMSVNSNKGVEATVQVDDSRDVFSETFSRAIVEVEDSQLFENFAKEMNIPVEFIGKVTDGKKFICNDIEKNLDELSNIYFNKFQEVVEQDI
jgi:phosphoribosylformylglycinamidine synthase